MGVSMGVLYGDLLTVVVAKLSRQLEYVKLQRG